MTAAEGFARRWSRLKRSGAPPAIDPPVVDPQIIQPPDAETIPLEDIAIWLRQAVPQAWRQLALRRLWVSDPAISTHIGLADYAWDWNTEGGSPGWGPLSALDDVTELLARAIGTPTVDATAMAQPSPQVATLSEQPAHAGLVPGCEPNAVETDPCEPAPPDAPKPYRRRGGAAAPV